MTSPEDKTARLQRASQNLQHPKAGPWLVNEARKTPDDLRIWWLLAHAYGLKHPQKAAKAFRRVLRLSPPEEASLLQVIRELEALHEDPASPVSPMLQRMFESGRAPEWLWHPPYTMQQSGGTLQPPAPAETQKHTPVVSEPDANPTRPVQTIQRDQAEASPNSEDFARLTPGAPADTQKHPSVPVMPAYQAGSGSPGILKRSVSAFSTAAFGVAGALIWIVTMELIILYVIDVLRLLDFGNLFNTVFGLILGILGIFPIALSAINIYINMALAGLAIGAAAGLIALTLGAGLSRIHKPTAYGVTALASLGASAHLYNQLIPQGSRWITEYEYIGGWEFHSVVFVLAGLIMGASALAILLDEEDFRETEETPAWVSAVAAAPFRIAGKGVGLSFNVWAAGAETATSKSDKSYEIKSDPKFDLEMQIMGHRKKSPRDYRELAKLYRKRGGAQNRRTAKLYDDLAKMLEGHPKAK